MIVWQRTHEPRPFAISFYTPASLGIAAASSDFLDLDGTPIRFKVEWQHGRAEVPDPLGRWMVDNGYARRTRQVLIEETRSLIIPERTPA